MARATKAESERTAHRIVEIATNQFRDRGYVLTDLVTVATEAGVTRGAIYHHFPSKQDLFSAVVMELHAQLQLRIEQVAAPFDDPWEQLVVGCAAFMNAAIDPDVHRILLLEAPVVLGWETWRELDEQTSFSSLTDVMQQLEESGEIASGSAEASARLLSGAMNEAVLWIATQPDTKVATSQVMASLTVMIRSLHIPA